MVVWYYYYRVVAACCKNNAVSCSLNYIKRIKPTIYSFVSYRIACSHPRHCNSTHSSAVAKLPATTQAPTRIPFATLRLRLMALSAFLPPNPIHQPRPRPDFLYPRTNLMSGRLTAPIRCSCAPHRVLVTAPLSYAARLSPYLLSQDLRPVIAPTITTTMLIDHRISPLQDALLRLHEYDVLACISRLSISSVSSQLLGLCQDSLEAVATALQASGVRIAALGADALAVKQLLGRPVDIIPLDPSPSGLVQFLQADQSLKRASVLCPVPIVTEMPEPDVVPNFLKLLQEAEFRVTAVPAYETRPVKRRSLLVELAMLANIDAIVISSTGEAMALSTLLTESERNSIVARVKEGELVLAAHGPVTAAGIEKVFSLTPIVSENSASFEGVAQAVARELSKDSLVLPS